MIAGEQDGWILIAARWPDKVSSGCRKKVAQLEDPRVVRLYRCLSELRSPDETNDPLLAEAVDIMVRAGGAGGGCSGELDLDGAGGARYVLRPAGRVADVSPKAGRADARTDA